MRLSKNFTSAEMACPLTGECVLQDGWIEILQELRDRCGFPFNISSGCRTYEYNATLKNSGEHSFHLIGNKKFHVDTCAVDIATKRLDHRALLIFTAQDMGLSLGIYPSHIHVDARTSLAGQPRREWKGTYGGRK